MTPQELRAVLAQGEDASVEFKRCGAQPERDTFETVCSFANRQGGTIFLGVNDDGTIEGVNPKLVREIERNIVNVISNPNSFNATPATEFERIQTDDGLVLKLWVPVGPSVYRYKGEVYDRRGDADVKVRDDAQISMMYMRKQNAYSERRIYPYITKDDLRLDVLDRVRDLIAARNPNHPWLNLDDDEFFRSAKLYGRDHATGEKGFTLAAAMLLGTDELIFDLCPAYKTDAIVRLRNVDRYDDRLIVKTNLVDAYDQLLAFATQHLPDPFILENGVTVSARAIICRELVSNMLIHREYAHPFIAKLVIDRNGIRTENASRSLFSGAITLDNFEPTPKNPTIADFFHQIGRADELGSGTRNLTKYSAMYSGKAPTLTEGDVFVAQVPVPWNTQIDGEARKPINEGIPNSTEVSSEVRRTSAGPVPDQCRTLTSQQRAVYARVSQSGQITSAEVETLLGVKQRRARTILNELRDLGFIRKLGSAQQTRYVLVAEK